LIEAPVISLKLATLAASEASATEASLEFFFTILPQDDERIDGPAVFKYQYKVFKSRDGESGDRFRTSIRLLTSLYRFSAVA